MDTAQSAPVIVAEGLTRSFGRPGRGRVVVRALEGLSLRVGAGEIYGLVGCDGAGKTTAMRILAGMIAPDGGDATVLGMSPLSRAAALREAIGYMPQHYSLYGDLTVEENLRFFSRMFCLPRGEYAERRERLLRITRLAPFADRRADALSGGMYKKLALACALLPRPRALLLDEPTNGVDPVSRRELWALLFEFVAEGMAILVSTAYMDEAARCHRVGLIHRGRLLLEGPPAALVAAFARAHATVELDGGDRDRCEELLDAHPQVVATSAAGTHLRAIVRGGAEELARVAEQLAQEGGGPLLRAVEPTVEDLFLAATAETEGR